MATPIARYIYTKDGKIQTGFSNVDSYKGKISISRNCCCIDNGKVLFWTQNCDNAVIRYTAAKVIYNSIPGVICHDASNWTGNINDYRLIIWSIATSEPIWWGTVAGGWWPGRMLITSEHIAYMPSIIYVNSLSNITGISCNTSLTRYYNYPNYHVPTPSEYPATNPHPLTVGQAKFATSAASMVSGGISLSQTIEDSQISWIAENTKHFNNNDVSFVVSADSNIVIDSTYQLTIYNTTFLKNLYNVPV